MGDCTACGATGEARWPLWRTPRCSRWPAEPMSVVRWMSVHCSAAHAIPLRTSRRLRQAVAAAAGRAATGGTPTCQECPNHRCACTPMHANEQGMSRGTEPAGKEHARQLRAARGSPGCPVSGRLGTHLPAAPLQITPPPHREAATELPANTMAPALIARAMRSFSVEPSTVVSRASAKLPKKPTGIFLNFLLHLHSPLLQFHKRHCNSAATMLLTELLLELPPEERAMQAAARLPASLIEYADTLAELVRLLQLADTRPAAMAAVAAQVAAEAQRAQDQEVRERAEVVPAFAAKVNYTAPHPSCFVRAATVADRLPPPPPTRSPPRPSPPPAGVCL